MDDSRIRKILTDYKRIAVIGLSPDMMRASYGVSRYMIGQGYEIVGVRPDGEEILGRPVYRSLKDIPGPLEIVNVFRQPEAVPKIVDEIEELIKTQAKERHPKV